MTRNTADRLICRVPDNERTQLLDALYASSHEQVVMVERSHTRRLEDAERVLGTILGVAFVPSAPCTTALVIRPVDPKRRIIVVPASQLCRVRAATQPWRNSQNLEWKDRWQAGEVLAGPPLGKGER